MKLGDIFQRGAVRRRSYRELEFPVPVYRQWSWQGLSVPVGSNLSMNFADPDAESGNDSEDDPVFDPFDDLYLHKAGLYTFVFTAVFNNTGDATEVRVEMTDNEDPLWHVRQSAAVTGGAACMLAISGTWHFPKDDGIGFRVRHNAAAPLTLDAALVQAVKLG